MIGQVIGQITYSKRHGFLENNTDVDGMIGYLGRLFSYVAPVSGGPRQMGYKPLTSDTDRTNAMARPTFPEEPLNSSTRQGWVQTFRLPGRHLRETANVRATQGNGSPGA